MSRAEHDAAHPGAPHPGPSGNGPAADSSRAGVSVLVEHLVGVLERSANPAADWSTVRAEVERRLAQHTAARPEPPRRTFAGFEREAATYAAHKPELLRTAPGKFVAIAGDELAGPEDTYGDALRAGYRRFGRGPLYVKQVLADEPIAAVPGEVNPCRP